VDLTSATFLRAPIATWEAFRTLCTEGNLPILVLHYIEDFVDAGFVPVSGQEANVSVAFAPLPVCSDILTV
jgi:hypothetical protein